MSRCFHWSPLAEVKLKKKSNLTSYLPFAYLFKSECVCKHGPQAADHQVLHLAQSWTSALADCSRSQASERAIPRFQPPVDARYALGDWRVPGLRVRQLSEAALELLGLQFRQLPSPGNLPGGYSLRLIQNWLSRRGSQRICFKHGTCRSRVSTSAS